MKTWYVKEFSKLAKMSVRTLHHYDEIGLLKPSLRSSNKYRLYSEQDLQRLERIIALKFFGFNLKQITKLIGKDEDIVHHLKAQQTCLAEQIKQLHHVNRTIDELLAASAKKFIDWSTITKLIEAYNMTDYLKQTWVNQAFSPEQLKQLAALDKKLTPAEQKEFAHRWELLFTEVTNNLDQDPKSAIAQELAKKWMHLIDENYGEYEELKDAITMAYKHNKLPHRPFNQKLWDWIEQAVTHMQKKNR